ncbi:MAG: efflux RND transporter permease subunit [Yoonia sp.]|nr:efflux RND transporter permease subunit [Yoonia sp.]MDG1768556.1 efflux RND transporter permease subunit [Yoonia sp.]MDG1867194.1 efflux RND transporter permease subunit [Yoonia sp.]
MNALIDTAFSRTRVVFLIFIAILGVGAYAYVNIPKESTPEIPIPIAYVSTGIDGISPEDSERLLIDPLETELGSLTGLKTMTSHAGEGFANVQLEFEPGGDVDEAIADVREAVDRAKGNLPDDAREPGVFEINTALFPILTAILSGPVPERTLNDLATDLKDDLEALSGVLEVDVGGSRTELLEVVIDPTVFETYNISFDELIGQINRNNRLIAAGAIETGAGRLVLKVPGLIEDIDDVMEMPVKVRGDTVVTFAELANVRRSFEDPTSFARINGQPALALEIKKRSGANVIDTVRDAKAVIAKAEASWPDTVTINYLQDESKQVKSMLADLEANVIAAILLVMIVIVWALGLRSALLVGLAIPGAFLTGVAALWFMGYTMNIIVLFSLILVVGMLVDGAIVTVELADRRLQEGAEPKVAFADAAKRMAWPIIASTMTTLSVFFPLLFWSGMVGEFMKFLPITVILTLGASLFMALIFIPVTGGIIGKKRPLSSVDKATFYETEQGDPRKLPGLTGMYVRMLNWSILRPGVTITLALVLLLGGFKLYGQFGNGVTFFPEQEPDFMQVQVRARDNFSIFERDALVRQVEARLFDDPAIASVYARSVAAQNEDAEIIGTIQLELTEWDTRRKAEVITEDIREKMADIAGIDIQVEIAAGGPAAGKPINVKIISNDDAARLDATGQVLAMMGDIGGFTDVTDTRPLPGVEWRLRVDRSEAARFGADVSLLGQAVQLLTQGITVADYRPDDVDGSVDIRVRFPAQDRTLEELESLRVPTNTGLVPIANFVTFEAAPRTGTINRVDQERVVSIEANVGPGINVNEKIVALRTALAETDFPDAVEWSFGGEAEDQAETMAFLGGAFASAILLMFVILLTQFNNFYQAFVVMSAIIFSIGGVLIGLIITGRPFGIVMGGIGVIALAGIVVNNNIVLIDTFNDLRKDGKSALEAALRSGAQRLRPVFLTSITTALGLMPMVIGLNINFFTREIVYGAPSTQWWTELSSAIAGGVVITMVLTLIVTPAMLVFGENRTANKAARKQRRADKRTARAAAKMGVPAE